MLRIKNESKQNGKVISMKEMKPFQVGRVTSGNPTYKGQLVMRTAGDESGAREVINISHPRKDNCWTSPLPTIVKVRLLPSSEKIELELSN